MSFCLVAQDLVGTGDVSEVAGSFLVARILVGVELERLGSVLALDLALVGLALHVQDLVEVAVRLHATRQEKQCEEQEIARV